MTSQEYCKIAVAALEDRKAEDVKIIDIREISPVADYFVIADGDDQNQIQAMRDAAEALYKAGLKTKQIEEILVLPGFSWITVNIIVIFFQGRSFIL